MKRTSGAYILNPIFSVLVVLLSACYPSPTVPIEMIRYEAASKSGPRTLLVFLPGNGDPITVFQKKGLVEAVRDRDLPVDMITVNAHVGYYMNGSISARLKQDVIGPARARGYARIWMVGNSLGGYGSILYASANPDDITGVVLLGPFLGKKEVIDEIKQAGGLTNWKPGEIQKRSEEEWENNLWLWFKARAREEQFGPWGKDCGQRKKCYPKIYLGYGRGDRFSYAQDYLASFLPPDHVIAIDGGHDWSTWKKLWIRFLDENILQP